jgi:hypothetical protein
VSKYFVFRKLFISPNSKGQFSGILQNVSFWTNQLSIETFFVSFDFYLPHVIDKTTIKSVTVKVCQIKVTMKSVQ